MEAVRRKARVFVVEAIVRKTYSALNNGKKIIAERVDTIIRPGKGGSILAHVGINNA